MYLKVVWFMMECVKRHTLKRSKLMKRNKDDKMLQGKTKRMRMIFLLGMSALLLACGKTNPASDFQYDLIDDGEGIIIKNFTGKGPKVMIPEKIDGVLVVEIGDHAFDGSVSTSSNNKAGITSITLPDSIKKIGNNVFANTAITKFNLPDSVVEIGGHVFLKCLSLKKVHISDGLKAIPSSVFCTCHKLTTVNLPTSLESIGYMAFWDCGELAELTMPVSLINVKFMDSFGGKEDRNNKAFEGCNKLPIKIQQTIQSWGYTGSF